MALPSTPPSDDTTDPVDTEAASARLAAALDTVRDAPFLLDGMRQATPLAEAAASVGADARAVEALASAARDDGDQLTAIAAIHALARVHGPSSDEVDDVLVALLHSSLSYRREHAAWAFGSRLPRTDAVRGLVGMLAAGGFEGMLAQRAIGSAGRVAPDPIAEALLDALHADAADPSSTNRTTRRLLVESLGLVARASSGSAATETLVTVAENAAEPLPVRAAALAALGDRGSAARSTTAEGLRLGELAARTVAAAVYAGGALEPSARLAAHDLGLPGLGIRHLREHPAAITTGRTDDTAAGSDGDTVATERSRGLTIVQLFLHADIDGRLSRVGAGDNGGIATLLVRLGDALLGSAAAPGASTPGGRRVDRVVTLSRGTEAAALSSLDELRSGARGHLFAPVPFLAPPVSSADAWQHRIEIERGVRRVLTALEHVDAIHLRMGDVGTLAAASVARELGIPVVFTVAPDPHGAIHAADMAGTLTRADFGEADAREHLWLRSTLVERVASDAAHTVLFPRQQLERDLRELIGIDISVHPERHTIIAEGIDLAVIDAATAAVSAASAHPDDATAIDEQAAAALAEFDALLAELPPERRGLPVLLSVGRLHAVKGMAALVEAWHDDPALRERCTLVIAGGSLENPTADERAQLDRIAEVTGADTAVGRAASGLLLAGHRPNGVVAHWLAATRLGRPGLSAPAGAYACASVKEEFGIALLEAMAAGLVVVAPNGGGPATYVEDGVTGILARTTDRASLTAALVRALDLAAAPSAAASAAAAHTMVLERFTIGAMATALTRVYGGVSGTTRRGASVASPDSRRLAEQDSPAA